MSLSDVEPEESEVEELNSIQSNSEEIESVGSSSEVFESESSKSEDIKPESSKPESFKPIDVKSLDNFVKEQQNKSEESEPDFNRFKMLFEKPAFEEEEAYAFEAIYDAEKQQEEIVFKPLFERNEVTTDSLKDDDPDSKNAKAENQEDIIPEEPEETIEEKAYREGFERGLAEGTQEGEKSGYDEGFKKGEKEGLEKGEKEGFEKGEQEGIDKGVQIGEEQAKTEGDEKAKEILLSLDETLKTADQTLELLVEKYEVRIISLIQQIAQKVVLAQVEIDDTIAKEQILDALKNLVEPEEITLFVSLADYEYIEMIKDEFFEQIESLSRISVRSDASIKRGGCKIETNTATITTNPESRLQAIFEAIKSIGNS